MKRSKYTTNSAKLKCTPKTFFCICDRLSFHPSYTAQFQGAVAQPHHFPFVTLSRAVKSKQALVILGTKEQTPPLCKPALLFPHLLLTLLCENSMRLSL